MTELLEIKGQQLLLAFKVGARDVIKKRKNLTQSMYFQLLMVILVVTLHH